MARKNMAILLFGDVEVLDFAGPFEVFSVTDELNNHQLLNTFTVAKTAQTIVAKNGLKIVPDCDFTNHPIPDFILIPGVSGTRAILRDQDVLQWVIKVIWSTVWSITWSKISREHTQRLKKFNHDKRRTH